MGSGFVERYGDQLRLVAGGVGVMIVMVVLSLVSVGYHVDWLHVVEDKEDSRKLETLHQALLDAMSFETSLRAAVVVNSAAITTAHATTNTRYSSFRAAVSLLTATSTLTNLDTLYLAYEASSNQPDALSAHLDFNAAAASIVFFEMRRTLSPRGMSVVDQLAIQQAKWRMTSLTTQLALAHRAKFSGDTARPAEISELAQAGNAASMSLGFLSASNAAVVSGAFPLNLISTAAATVTSSYAPVSPGINTTVTTTTANAAYNGASNAIYYLDAEARMSGEALSSNVRTQIIVFGIGAGLAFLAMVLCMIIVVRHVLATRRARELLLAFRDTESAKAMFEMYQPILCDMRVLASRMPPAPRNDVEKEYSAVAKLMIQLRPLMPQALFGELNAHHKRLPSGAWDISAQPIRLEMGMAFCNCTVLTIAINSATLENGDKNNVGAVLQESSMALHAIVEEVNNAGGIVTGCGSGCRVSCVWNATHLVEDAAFVAVKTARVIDRRLAALNIGRDLNVATGPCIVANSKIGGRKHVTFIGGAFDVAEKLLLLNEVHVSRLITDYETFKELPREQQRSCKPIAVISDKDEGPPIVVMSADDDAFLKGEWKQYDTAFNLYQNHMLSESLAEFRKYLQNHPDDHCATWLIENVLEPKLARRKSTNRLM